MKDDILLTPEPEKHANEYRLAAQGMEQRARQAWKQAARRNWLILMLMLATCALLAVPTGLVFINDFEWPGWLAYSFAFALHTALAFLVHGMLCYRKAGKNGAAATCAALAAILIVAFLVVSVLRANAMIEGGRTPLIAWAAALIFWLVECTIPVGLGIAYENSSDHTANKHARLVRAREHAALIRNAGSDADGVWSDAEERLKQETEEFEQSAFKDSDAVNPHEAKENVDKREWLRSLWEAHPGRRYRQLNGG